MSFVYCPKIGQNLGIISSTLSLMGGMYVALRPMIGLTLVRHRAESLRSRTVEYFRHQPQGDGI